MITIFLGGIWAIWAGSIYPSNTLDRTPSFSANFFGKPEKPWNALDRKIQKTAIIVGKNRKPKTKLIGENPQTTQDTKTEKLFKNFCNSTFCMTLFSQDVIDAFFSNLKQDPL